MRPVLPQFTNHDFITSAKVVRALEQGLARNDAWRVFIRRMNIREEEILKGRLPDDGAKYVVQFLRERLFTMWQILQYMEGEPKLLGALVYLKPFEEVMLSPCEKTCYEIRSGFEQSFKLTCRASGFPPPQYQWYYSASGEPEHYKILTNETGTTLALAPISKSKAGFYTCKVTNKHPVTLEKKEKEMPPVQIIVVSDGDLIVCPSPIEEGSLRIIQHPSLACDGNQKIGSSLMFTCKARGKSPIRFHWSNKTKPIEEYGNSIFHVIKGEKESTLVIKPLQKIDDSAKFLIQCVVRNDEGILPSSPVQFQLDISEQNEFQYFAKGKVALIIGNSKYGQVDELPCAKTDCEQLGKLLTEMEFNVIACYDLTLSQMWQEIDKFCSYLADGFYGVFAFAGHGFQMNGCPYFEATDRNVWKPHEMLSAQHVLCRMQEKNLALCCLLLDSCREARDDGVKVEFSKPRRNQVIFYASAPDSNAYECKSRNSSIFMTGLLKHIAKREPIETVFIKVKKEIGADSLASNKQIPVLDSCLADDRGLWDPVDPDSLKHAQLTEYLRASQ